MTNSPHIMMKERFEFFESEKKIEINAAKKIIVASDNYRGVIGFRVKQLRKQHGKTLNDITDYINAKLGTKISSSTLYSWALGSQPRQIGKQVEDALASMIKGTNAFEGGAWVSGEEVRERMLALNEYVTVADMMEVSDISQTTLFNWLAGFTSTRREHFDEFEKTIHKLIASKNNE